jgi:hypothetical protein
VWNGSTWSNVFDGEWRIDAGPNYYSVGELHVWALAASGDELYIAGNFAGVGRWPSYGFAIWHDTPAPTVAGSLTNGQMVLSWPRSFQHALLETTESFLPAAWSPAAGITWDLSETLTNDVRVHIPPGPGMQRFYRLRWH